MPREYYLNYFCPMSQALRKAQTYPMNPGIVHNQVPVPPSNFEQAPGSPTNLGTQYTEGYLRTQIGKRMKIMFLIGTNIVQDREGILLEVGISYIVIKEVDTNNKLLCDMYSIKFVTIY
jgi:hypothetical protein